MKPVKQPTTYIEQITKLKERGCIIDDEAAGEKMLHEVNYYRLTAYFLPFLQFDGSYQNGLTIERVYKIYEFDRKLRNLIFSVIEEIEIHLRTQLAYFHAHKYGAIGYQNPSNFSKLHNGKKFQELYQQAIRDNGQVLFVKHHQENYGGIFPIWVLIELFSFGMLSHFYGDLNRADQRQIANQEFGVRNDELVSWLKCCTELRNICAHYGRLYFRKFPSIPKQNCKETYPMDRNLFSNILMVKYLYHNKSKWNNSFLTPLSALIEEYCTEIELSHIGFPSNWYDLLKK